MRMTVRELRKTVRKTLLESWQKSVMGKGMKPIDGGILNVYKPEQGSYGDADDCVEEIIKMLGRLEDPETQWVEIEMQARQLCKSKGVKFGPVMFEALKHFDIYY